MHTSRSGKAMSLAAVSVVFGLSVAESASAASPAARALLEQNPAMKFDPGAVLVQFKPSATQTDRATARAMVGGSVGASYTLVPNLELMNVSIPAEAAVKLLSASGMILYAEPDYVVHHTTNDTYYTLLWGLNNTGQVVNGDPGTNNADINAPEAWTVFTGDPNFVIADIDTGANLSHADLQGNLWVNPGEIAGNGIDDDGDGYIDDVNGWNFYDHNNNPNDLDGHGTHTAGTIGAKANNGIGVAGVNWQCRIMPLKFLGPSGGFTSDAISAVQFAAAKGVKVSNNSWGGGGFSQSLYNAINAAKSVNHIFCAAAGNNGSNNDVSPFYPASYNLDNIISVAATDNDDLKASFSNYGATSVDIGGPGVNIASTYGSGYAYLSGTSMATPHVTGVVALVYGQNPSWTYTQVRNKILSTARPVASLAGKCVTGGVLNAQAALNNGPPPNTPPTVTISSPSNGSSVVSGTTVTFTGSANDTQDGNLSASLTWTSNLQGAIGSGASFTRNDLVIGTHTITASATDSGGLSGQATVTLTVTSGVTIPAAPGNPNAIDLGGGSAQFTWADNSNNEDGFNIQRQKRVNGVWTNTVTLGPVGPNVTSFTDNPGLGRFRYRVRSFNAAGASAWTAWDQVNLN